MAKLSLDRGYSPLATAYIALILDMSLLFDPFLQSIYDYNSSLHVAVDTSNLQAAAFSSVGLNLTSYLHVRLEAPTDFLDVPVPVLID
jgi:hypothetical protein